jgi:hypothetical protein
MVPTLPIYSFPFPEFPRADLSPEEVVRVEEDDLKRMSRSGRKPVFARVAIVVGYFGALARFVGTGVAVRSALKSRK